MGANPLANVFFYASIVILSSYIYRLFAIRPNPSVRIFSAIDVAFDVRAALTLSILVFTFLTIQASFNPTLSFLSLAGESLRLEHSKQLLNPVVELYPAIASDHEMGENLEREEEPGFGSLLSICKGNFIEIPKIGVSAPIVEGKDNKALEKGVWRLPQSAKPGTVGNAVLTGHRWSLVRQPYGDVFYHLPKLSPGDQFDICYEGRALKYEIFETKVIEVGDEEFFNPSGTGKFATLYTCHPLWMANKRFVAIAEET